MPPLGSWWNRHPGVAIIVTDPPTRPVLARREERRRAVTAFSPKDCPDPTDPSGAESTAVTISEPHLAIRCLAPGRHLGCPPKKSIFDRKAAAKMAGRVRGINHNGPPKS